MGKSRLVKLARGASGRRELGGVADWYNERLRGVSRGEDYELVFASVPLDVWDKGPAAANAWIKANLPEGMGSIASIASGLPPELEPLPDIDSPFTYGWNSSLRVTVVAGAQNLPFYRYFSSEKDHRRALEACRARAERLLKSLREGRYNARPEYLETLEYYVEDLPKAPGVGNILLAYDDARILHSMFLADADYLPEGFASQLKSVIGNQFALDGFYDLVSRHEQAVNTGNWTQPFPMEAAQSFFGAVEENTPRFFERDVGEGLRRVERSAPPSAPAPATPKEPGANWAATQPPVLPPGMPDAAHSHRRQIATAANALWSVFLKGKDLPVALEGWTQAAHKLGENIGPILDFLRGLGTPM